MKEAPRSTFHSTRRRCAPALRNRRITRGGAMLVLALVSCGLRAEPVTFVASFGEYLEEFSENGYVLTSTFPRGGGSQPTLLGWVGTPEGEMHRVGLYDALHTSSTGRNYTLTDGVNRHGVSIGSSSIFGETLTGSSAWVANADGYTLRLGFYDAEHTSPSGATRHRATAINDLNQVIGYSSDAEWHQTGWIAGPYTPLTGIGLFDAAHTSSDGNHWSEPTAINDAGFVLGLSRYYNGRDAATFGRTSWLYTPWKQFRLVGFQSGVHRTSTGWHDSEARLLTNSGYFAGFSRRYLRDARSGATAWITHVAGPNRPVGFYDGIHRSATGAATSSVNLINELGMVAGDSLQYAGASGDESGTPGRTTWLGLHSGKTIRVGLYDAEHSLNGRQINTILRLGEDGWTLGYTERYDPATGSNRDGAGGRSAWLADPDGHTLRIGPVDDARTRWDGYRYVEPGGMNARYVWGFANDYSSGTLPGAGAWIYDRKQRTLRILNEDRWRPPGLRAPTSPSSTWHPTESPSGGIAPRVRIGVRSSPSRARAYSDSWMWIHHPTRSCGTSGT